MHTIKKLKRTIVFILKLALFASLFGIFFGIFGINNPWLFNLSRTTGVTMVTFVVLGIGGSALGPIAIQQALNHLHYNELPAEKRGGPRLYVEDNIDPERMAALLTDGIRAKLLENAGYETQILEFIDMEHTPKNLLIRAVKRQEGSKKLPEELKACMEAYHVKPTLADLLTEKEEP